MKATGLPSIGWIAAKCLPSGARRGDDSRGSRPNASTGGLALADPVMSTIAAARTAHAVDFIIAPLLPEPSARSVPDVRREKFLELGQHPDARGGERQVVVVGVERHEAHRLARLLQSVAHDLALLEGDGRVVPAVH